MKKLMLLIMTLFTVQANAGLLTFSTNQTSYLANESVLVDITVNNINPDAAELSFDMSFNESLLAFNSFVFSNEVINSAFFTDADTFKANNILTIYSSWFSAVDLPATSFTLGQVSLTALASLKTTFTDSNLYVADEFFNQLPPEASQTNIPEPQTLLLFSALFVLLITRRKHVK